MDVACMVCGFGERGGGGGEGFCSRMCSAIVGVVIGFILVPVFCGLIIWNEGRAVKTAKMLDEGKNNYVDAKCTLDPANDGKLVHITCTFANTTTTYDKDFNVTSPYFRLDRGVEMYQWLELTKEINKKTCYYQSKDWKSTPISTGLFHPPNTCATDCNLAGVACSNRDFPVTKSTIYADPLVIGTYNLPTDLAGKLSTSSLIRPEYVAYQGQPVPASRIQNGFVYLNDIVQPPNIGDFRIKWAYNPTATTISILAKQQGSTFVKWTSSYDSSYGLYEIKEGSQTADSMIDELKDQNKVVTWVLRFLFIILIWVGLQLICGPLTVMPEIIPCIGQFIADVVGHIICYINCCLAIPIGFFFIAVGWVAYRPYIGIPLLIIGCILCCLSLGLLFMLKKSPLFEGFVKKPQPGVMSHNPNINQPFVGNGYQPNYPQPAYNNT